MLSDNEFKALLRQEELIAEILRIREAKEAHSWWDTARAAFIPSATAVLTVLITSIAGYYVQRSLKSVESGLTMSRENAQLARDVGRRANAAIAGVLKLNDERMKLALGEFDLLDRDERRAISVRTNQLQQQWRQDREDSELDLFLLFAGDAAVFQTWRRVRLAAEALTECVELVYVRAQSTHALRPVCPSENDEVLQAVVDLRASLKTGYARLAVVK